jgi:hypothetical protein
MYAFFILLPFFTSQTSTFSVLLVAFVGVAVGLGIGWLIWGNVVRSLVASFDTVSAELEMLKMHSLAQKYGADGQPERSAEEFYKENNRLNLYIKQMETDRNRLLAEIKNTQKQLPSDAMLQNIQDYEDLARERNHVWKQLLESKQLAENLHTSLAQAEQKNNELIAENTALEETIATEMQTLRQKYLQASDDWDILFHKNETLQAEKQALIAENAELTTEKNFWHTEFGNERKITTALSTQVANMRTDALL